MGFSNCTYDVAKMSEKLGIDKETLEQAMMESARTCGYAKIWDFEDKGKYGKANISVSKYDKESENYHTEFNDKYVSLVGHAYEKAKKLDFTNKGIPIIIVSGDTTNNFNAEKKAKYTNHALFDFRVVDLDSKSNSNKENVAKKESSKKAPAKNEVEEDDDDLPF